MTTRKEISIIIPVRNEEKYITRCIDSLINQTYPQEKYEIIVLDGMSTDNTREILKNFQSEYENLIRFFDNHKITQVAGRNTGVKYSEGNIIVMFSGHAYADVHFLSTIMNEFNNSDSNVAVLGANILPAEDEQFLGTAVAKVQMSTLGGGSSAFMISQNNKYVDSPGFPAYRREIIFKIGLFDERFVIGEDIDINWRIKSAGFKLMLCSKAVVYYYRRHNSIKLFSKHMFYYGKAKGQFIRKYPSSNKWVNLFPILLIICIAGLPIAYFINLQLFQFLALVSAIYLLFVCISTVSIVFRSRNYKDLICSLLYILEHLAFGFGLILGLVKGIRGQLVSV